MRDLATISRIQKLEPIEGKDRIELATVENYPVIVQKGEHEVGDLVVYMAYDTVLPQKPEFEFLRARCWSELYQGFRIKNMKMSGVYSSGIVFPLSILPEKVKIKEGVDVSEILEIRKYDPEEFRGVTLPRKKMNFLLRFLMRFKWFRRIFKKESTYAQYPATVSKSDETNIEKLFNKLKCTSPETEYYVTEKMEGQSVAIMLYGKKRKFLVYSRNTLRDPAGTGNWESIARQYDLEKELRKEKANYAVQGEICRAGVQGNIYGFGTPRLFVFKVTNTDTGESLNFNEMSEFCFKHNLEMVPLVYSCLKLPRTLEEMVRQADGHSVFQKNGCNVLREGLVWRSLTDQSVSFKVKSRKYAAKFEAMRKTE